MGRKPHVDRSPEEKWQIVQEGIKSGNVSETCRRHGIAPNLFYRRVPHPCGFVLRKSGSWVRFRFAS